MSAPHDSCRRALVATAVLAVALASFAASPPPAHAEPLEARIFQRGLDDAEIDAITRQLAADYPELTELHEIGRSARGRPILALAIGRNLGTDRARPSVFLNGGHHGNEALAPVFPLDAAHYLLSQSDDPDVSIWLDQLVVWVVPMVNPDGRWADHNKSGPYGRKNGRDTDGDGLWETDDGVDINRNYPFSWGRTARGSDDDQLNRMYRGPEPASEPETRAVMALAHAEHFAGALSYHMGAHALLAPYTTDAVGHLRPTDVWTIAEDIARHTPSHPAHGRWKVVRQLYPVDGGDQDWLYAEFGTTALLVEGGRFTPAERATRERVVETSRAVWQQLLDHIVEGPTLGGWVVDTTGHPVVAEITIDGIEQNEWERWHTRCRDGRFDRLLGEPGEYVVRVHLADGTELTETVTVTADGGPRDLLIRVPTGAATQLTACTGPGDWSRSVLRSDVSSSVAETVPETVPETPAETIVQRAAPGTNQAAAQVHGMPTAAHHREHRQARFQRHVRAEPTLAQQAALRSRPARIAATPVRSVSWLEAQWYQHTHGPWDRAAAIGLALVAAFAAVRRFR